MITGESTEILKESHTLSAKMAEIVEISYGKISHRDAYPEHLHELHLLARNAVFKELSPNRNISGEAVVEGVESLLYALGQDMDTAQTSAARLAPVVKTRDQAAAPEIILSRSHYMGRISDVGLLATDANREASVRLRAKSLSHQPSLFNSNIADLVIPYAGGSFSGDREGEWSVSYSENDWPVDVNIKDLARAKGPAIFDDPEEALAFSDQKRGPVFMLIGSEAVFSMLDEAGSQNAAAVKNILEAAVKGNERPATENIDLAAAAGAGVKSLVGSDLSSLRMPAEAHPSILAQIPKPELLAASHVAIGEMSSEGFAKSSRLAGLKLDRKLEASISRIAGRVVSDLLDHAGISEISEDERALLEKDIRTGYVLSLPEHLPVNPHYEYPLMPFSRRAQRHNAARVMRSYQAG